MQNICIIDHSPQYIRLKMVAVNVPYSNLSLSKIWSSETQRTVSCQAQNILWKLLDATTESVSTMASSLQRTFELRLHLWLKRFSSFFFLSFFFSPTYFCTWSHSDTTHSIRILRKKGSARRRPLYLTTHFTRKRQTSMPPAEFEHTIPASEDRQTPRLRPRGHWDRTKMSRRRKNQDFCCCWMCIYECACLPAADVIVPSTEGSSKWMHIHYSLLFVITHMAISLI